MIIIKYHALFKNPGTCADVPAVSIEKYDPKNYGIVARLTARRTIVQLLM
jgi:hypothetical protein